MAREAIAAPDIEEKDREETRMPRASARLLACAAAAILISIPPARAGFDDKGPINYTVDGATASGYFKVVTEAINGIIRQVYPRSAPPYNPAPPPAPTPNLP